MPTPPASSTTLTELSGKSDSSDELPEAANTIPGARDEVAEETPRLEAMVEVLLSAKAAEAREERAREERGAEGR